MPAKVLVDRKVDRQFLRFPIHIQGKIIKAYRILGSSPLSGKKLKGELKNFYKYRVGDYRIVYRFDLKTETLTVVKIEHRQGVYR